MATSWAAAPAEITQVRDTALPAPTGNVAAMAARGGRSWTELGMDLADDFVRSLLGIGRPAAGGGGDDGALAAALAAQQKQQTTILIVGGVAVAGLLAYLALRR